jgi:CDP-diacylglycerol--glycerol-3-phosphate 3-phosphatidyltransferase
LRRRWLLAALIWLLVWLVACFLLPARWPYAERWLLLSGLTLAFMLAALWRKLPLNKSVLTGELETTFGPGNALSLARALAIGLLAGFLFLPWPEGALAWVVAGLYTGASIADGFDGYLARRSGRVTELGQWLDIELDGLGIIIVSLLGIGYGQLPLWFLSVGLARYFFVAGLWWRERQGKPIYDMPPSTHRRILAGMMMGMLTVVLWPILPAPMAQIAAGVIGVPVLFGFLRDWLFVSGRLNSKDESYLRVQRFLYTLFARGLPLLWRVVLPLSMLVVLQAAESWVQPEAWVGLLASWGLPGAAALATLAAITAVLGTLLAVLGIAGRLAVIPLFFPIGFDISTRGLTWASGLALVAALSIALFGTGPYTLWRPEEALLSPRGGASEPPPAQQLS